MNIDQIRDEVAEMMGYTKAPDPTKYTHDDGVVWLDSRGLPEYDEDTGAYCHPVPTTIDGIAALWPKGWRIEIVWHKGRLCWTATGIYDEKVEHDRGYANRIGEGTTEYEARLRLLHAVLTAERNAK